MNVSLDDVANDGNAAASENDNVTSDVEDVWGGAGDDQLTGNGGPNKLFGDAGNDHLDGLGGDDELRGGDGSDFLDGGGGADLLQGDAGSDYAEYDTYIDPVVVTLDGDPDDGADTNADGTADEGDNVKTDHVFGGSGNDHLSGDGLPNQLYGNGGDDTARGVGRKRRPDGRRRRRLRARRIRQRHLPRGPARPDPAASRTSRTTSSAMRARLTWSATAAVAEPEDQHRRRGQRRSDRRRLHGGGQRPHRRRAGDRRRRQRRHPGNR